MSATGLTVTQSHFLNPKLCTTVAQAEHNRYRARTLLYPAVGAHVHDRAGQAAVRFVRMTGPWRSAAICAAASAALPSTRGIGTSDPAQRR